MQAQRTPPKIDSPTVFATPVHHYASDPNIAVSPQPMHEAFSFTNIASRCNKRKNNDVNKSEILDMFASLMKDQDLKFTAVLDSISDVKLSMDCMSRKHDEVLKRMDLLEDENTKYVARIKSLEEKIETIERQNKATSIEIRNIPQPTTNSETKEDLVNIICKTAEALSIPLDSSSDINNVYRVNSNAQIKPIIADFTTVLKRDRFLISLKQYNRSQEKQEKLSTSTLNIEGPNRQVYISENLTQRDRKLYFQARQFAKNSGYSFCWTSFGRIFLRQAEGSPQIRIYSESDLETLTTKQ